MCYTADSEIPSVKEWGADHGLECARPYDIQDSNGMNLGGNLTINANATLDTTTSNRALTVGGTTTVNGTLTCNASAVSLGSGKTDGYGLHVASGGTFTGGTGTHTIGSCNLQSSTTFKNPTYFKNTGRGFSGPDIFEIRHF